MLKNKNDNGSEFQLATRGTKLRVAMNPRPIESVVFSTKALDEFKTMSGSSSNQMKKLTSFIRCSAGKQSIPAIMLNTCQRNQKL